MEIEKYIKSPWDNVYWFSRMLINSDRYGSIGSKSNILLTLAETINAVINSKDFKKEDETSQIDILSETVRNVLLKGRKEETAKYQAIERFCTDLKEEIKSVKDFEVFALTCKKIMLPINTALENIPGDDTIFVESVANALLDSRGVKGLANIISILDDVGSKGCMRIERQQIVDAFGSLRTELSNTLEKEELDIVLTAFCQEFERRVAQKRKGRAGRGVEGTTSLILDYFGIKSTHEPEHFTTGLEIDKWIKTKDGWLIGISCKRTLRERWKQAYTTDLDLLNRHKIKELWHVLSYDKDLSDDKITEIGSHRAILYLPDQSERFKKASKHPGMKKYIRPMTKFISDLKKQL